MNTKDIQPVAGGSVKVGHTATPSIDIGGLPEMGEDVHGYVELFQDGLHIANVYPNEGKRALETAVLIQQRFNAHDDLVKALQAMHKLLDRNLTFLDGEVCFPFESHDQGWNHVHEARDIVKSALTKAGPQ